MDVYGQGGCPVAGPYELVNLIAQNKGFAEEHAGAMGKGGTVDFGGVGRNAHPRQCTAPAYNEPGVYAGEPAGLVMTLRGRKARLPRGRYRRVRRHEDHRRVVPAGSLPPAHRQPVHEWTRARRPWPSSFWVHSRVVPIHHSTLPAAHGHARAVRGRSGGARALARNHRDGAGRFHQRVGVGGMLDP